MDAQTKGFFKRHLLTVLCSHAAFAGYQISLNSTQHTPLKFTSNDMSNGSSRDAGARGLQQRSWSVRQPLQSPCVPPCCGSACCVLSAALPGVLQRVTITRPCRHADLTWSLAGTFQWTTLARHFNCQPCIQYFRGQNWVFCHARLSF